MAEVTEVEHKSILIGVDRDIRRRCFSISIEDSEHSSHFVSSLGWEYSPPGAMVPQFIISPVAVQDLMNELYLAGIRPTCVSYDEEKKALSEHLSDMRSIVNHFLKMGAPGGSDVGDVLQGVRTIRVRGE